MKITAELLRSIFPQGVVNYVHDSTGWFEVNGLSEGTVPQNCEILDRGQERSAKDRREHFLVKTENFILFFRICTAMKGSSYDEFAVGRDAAIVTGLQAEECISHGKRVIESLCR